MAAEGLSIKTVGLKLSGNPKLSLSGSGLLSISVFWRHEVYSRSPLSSVESLIDHDDDVRQVRYDNVPIPRARGGLTTQFSEYAVGVPLRFAPGVEKFLFELSSSAKMMSFGAAQAVMGFEVLMELDVTSTEVREELEEATAARGTPRAEIERLRIERYESDGCGSEASRVCAVCLEEFRVGAEFAKLPCSHMFHQACIVPWLHKDQSCPLCRDRRLV